MSGGARAPGRAARVAVMALAAVPFVTGAAVLAGWYLGRPALVQGRSGLVPMQFDVAAGLLLAGAGLLLGLAGRRTAGAACGMAAAALGLATLAEYALGLGTTPLDHALWYLGVDRPRMEAVAAARAAVPGRMSANAAAGLLLCGVGLALVARGGAWRRATRAAPVLGMAAAGIATLGLLGYASGAPAAYAWGNLTQMAAHTAWALLFGGAAVAAWALLDQAERGEDVMDELPRLVAVAGVVATLGLWRAVADQQRAYAEATVTASAEALGDDLSREMGARVLALVRMARAWEYAGPPARDEWLHDAELTAEHFPACEEIAWVDSAGRVRWAAPGRASARLAGLDLAREPHRRAAMLSARGAREPRLTPLVALASGGAGVVAFVPVFPRGGGFDGYVAGAFRVAPIVEAVRREPPGRRMEVWVTDGGGSLVYGRPGAADAPRADLDVPLFGATWRLHVAPTGPALAAMRTATPPLVLLAGLLVTASIAWALRLLRTAHLRRADAERAAALLTGEVAERTRAKRALQAYSRELERSNRDLERFAYVASHDLQEPLRKIRAFGNLLADELGPGLGDAGHDYVRRMQGAAERMQVLISDLLAFSRVSTQARPFAPTDLGDVVRGVLDDLETRIDAAGGQVRVEGTLPVLEADATQMRQLLQNLVSNALKFHRPGVPPRVRVLASVGPAGDGGAGQACTIVVADDGIGFDEKYLDRIFEPFQRLHGRDQYDGTGIGLAICRRIVERHHGSITARSAPGQGAEFIVTLPARQRGEAAA